MKKLVLITLTALSLNAVAMEQLPVAVVVPQEEQIQGQQAAANQDVYAQERKAYLDRRVKAKSTRRAASILTTTGSSVLVFADLKNTDPYATARVDAAKASVLTGFLAEPVGYIYALPQTQVERDLEPRDTGCTIL